MSASDDQYDVAKELAALRHEKKNQALKKLPPNTAIQKRPLNHPPVASPYAGAHVQKVVYISRRTPIMSTVKRVKKLLQHVEKRALQGVDMKRQSHAQVTAELAEVSKKLASHPEEILVKASGRAMEQALRVGEWFRSREDELLCKVEVRTGSVAAVDDIVEMDHDQQDSDLPAGDVDAAAAAEQTNVEDTVLTGGETTLELLGDQTATLGSSAVNKGPMNASHELNDTEKGEALRKTRRRKRKKAEYDKDDLPEARIRWVKTVEVAISLRA